MTRLKRDLGLCLAAAGLGTILGHGSLGRATQACPPSGVTLPITSLLVGGTPTSIPDGSFHFSADGRDARATVYDPDNGYRNVRLVRLR